MKETSYQKLKRELKESKENYSKLKADFKSYSRGNIFTVTHYDCIFKIEDDVEKSLWMGNTTV